MQHVRTDSTALAINELSELISTALKTGEKVLWLVSGGSGATVSAEVSKRLAGQDLTHLSVTLSDERYGPLGHPDENWSILESLGFSVPSAVTYRPLTGASRAETTDAFAAWLEKAAQEADTIIGIFGIGADGHTAGIKPGSVAVTGEALAASFSGDDFERITITPAFIRLVTHGVTQVFGSEKHATLARLINENLPLETQPAQILKQIPTMTLYTDYEETQ